MEVRKIVLVRALFAFTYGRWRYGRLYLYVLCLLSLTDIVWATRRKGKVYACYACMYRGAPPVVTKWHILFKSNDMFRTSVLNILFYLNKTYTTNTKINITECYHHAFFHRVPLAHTHLSTHPLQIHPTLSLG